MALDIDRRRGAAGAPPRGAARGGARRWRGRLPGDRDPIAGRPGGLYRGLFSFLSPCVLPLFPSYLSFITGMSVNALTDDVTAETRRRIVLHSLAFVSGFSMIFVALGRRSRPPGGFSSTTGLDPGGWRRADHRVRLYIAGVLRIGSSGAISRSSSGRSRRATWVRSWWG